MNLPALLTSPGPLLFGKWTALLAVGWIAHALLRHRHARWRLILWRSLLCAGLALPLFSLVNMPGIRIPIGTENSAQIESPNVMPPITVTEKPLLFAPASAVAPTTATPAAATVAAPLHSALAPAAAPHPPRSWIWLFLALWMSGCAVGAFRLAWLHYQLARLRAAAHLPSAELQQTAQAIQMRLGLRQPVDVRVSEAVTSPFVCGVLRPMVILPRALADDLPPDALAALLSHEMAHLCQHDLAWCVAWRWVKTVCWFHPLVWGIPTAHNLACEQEADRLAAGERADSYAQWLAALALRVVTVPPVEIRLTVNGSSQIARRLKHLARPGAWNWKYSALGFSLAAAMFLVTAGCSFTQHENMGSATTTPASMEFSNVLVTIQDEDGEPIAGATVRPAGFRVQGRHAADAYGWDTNLFGPPEPAVTDSQGRAEVKYPVVGIPSEKEYTGAIYFDVSHPDFVTTRIQTYLIDGSEKPIVLQRGSTLYVSARYGIDELPVTNLVFNLGQEMVNSNDWHQGADGSWTCNKVLPGDHLIQAMGQLPPPYGEIVYSEVQAFNIPKVEKTMPDFLTNIVLHGRSLLQLGLRLEMKPGIRVEGRLDDHVPRPVKNGRVLIMVRPPQIPAWNNYTDVEPILKKYDNYRGWHTYRPIAEDGTFVFESVPPGGLDVIACGDGFNSKNGGDFEQKNGTTNKIVKNFAVPQAFDLTAPVTHIEVSTEPTATLELTARTADGKPVSGATVYLNPNVVRMNGIFGMIYGASSEEPYHTPPSLPKFSYSTTTDTNGFAVIRNIPAITHGMEVYSDKYQVPLQELNTWRHRYLRPDFTPGETNHFALTLEPKGSDYIGR